jgi:hypothetical protein
MVERAPAWVWAPHGVGGYFVVLWRIPIALASQNPENRPVVGFDGA